jgi:hypothetical protein
VLRSKPELPLPFRKELRAPLEALAGPLAQLEGFELLGRKPVDSAGLLQLSQAARPLTQQKASFVFYSCFELSKLIFARIDTKEMFPVKEYSHGDISRATRCFGMQLNLDDAVNGNQPTCHYRAV